MSSKVDYTTRKGSRGNPFSVLIPAILKRSVRQWNFIVANDSNGSHRCRNSANIRRNATLTLLIVVSSSCIDLAFCGQLSPSSLNGLGKGGSSTGSSGGKDSGGGKGLEDSESPLSLHHHHPHHRPHHHRYNNRQDRHGGSGSASSKNSVYSSSLYPSDSASLTYQDYSSSFGYYPEAYYEPRYHERPSREFSARSTSHPAMASASSSQVGFTDTEYGGLALATGHGGGHGGHHDGHGHGHYTTYYKTVNKLDQSSLGLLGLLGLLSLLSNVLLLLTTTSSQMMGAADMPGRRKRDTMMLFKLDNAAARNMPPRTLFEHLNSLLLPSLNVVGHAKDGRIPLNCTYQEICKTNRVLVQVFGAEEGRPMASIINTAIAKLLVDDKPKNGKQDYVIKGRHYSETTGVPTAPVLITESHLKEAGLAGRNGADCEVAYPTCEALDYVIGTNDIRKNSEKGPFRLPLLISPERSLAIILGQETFNPQG